MNENLSREMVKELLLDYLDNGYNDFDEEILSFEIVKDEVNIQTAFSVTLDVPKKYTNLVQGNRDEQLKFITKELMDTNFIDSISFNYLTGFYCQQFEGLDVDDFLINSDFYCVDREDIQIDFVMEYSMNRHEIELLFKDYKKCA